MGNEKFSVLAYVHQRKGGMASPSLARKTNAAFLSNYAFVPNEEAFAENTFRQWVQDIRNELVTAKGRNEDEKQKYNEMLNRAILGYEDDRGRLLAIVHDLVSKRRILHLPPDNRSYASLPEAIFAEIIGLNVLELVMKNRDGLEEIQVIGQHIFEVRNGKSMPSIHQLPSIRDLERIQQNLVLFNNDTLNPRKRWAEVVLRDGARVTMTGYGYTAEPTLTIRFYTVKRFDLAALTHPDLATIDCKMRDLILCLIYSYFNMVVIGPTNSGKTNLIKAFIAEMDDQERIITIESRFELHLKKDFPQKNIVEYEVDEEDPKHSGSQAFKLALRQSPKRICHAEIRDEDANLYVRACTRGHEGSITSVHVNELEDVPDAITDMCMLDKRGMDSTRLMKRITEYVTQIGFEMAVVNGKRKVVRIGEYVYLRGEVCVRDLAVFDDDADQWAFPGKLSEHAATKIKKNNRKGYFLMCQLGFIDREEDELPC